MRSIELFAGAGGLGMGLHAAGFHSAAVVERDPYCCETIRENKKRGPLAIRTWNLEPSDVRDVNFGVFEGALDLVSGGPPCQPFSTGGKHRAYEDTRDMFPQAVRAVREIRPSAFIFENVKGLTRERFRNYFEYIKLQLQHPEIILKSGETWSDHHARLERFETSNRREGLHYKVVTQVLNAADYGVPQKRHRVFFVGFRDDLGIEWAFPQPTHSWDALLWDQSSHGSYWDRHRVSKSSRFYAMRDRDLGQNLIFPPDLKPWRTVRDAISDLPPIETGKVSRNSITGHRAQLGARTYPGHTGSPVDEPAKALKAGVHGVPGGENMIANTNGSVRYFTMREAARLQTFPDDFLFTGSWSETMRQLGNAVPVDLAHVVGDSVIAQLRGALKASLV
ncbi:MAG TPA: DNA cytosine methyltransferase [Acidobacteriaceae bacterium]|jgi:DNA (cytosine-5)-methyltransferase 1